MSASVYERLSAMIIRGRIAPGTRVVEAEIAERLGVSRTPAREAIRRLHQEGLLIPTSTTRRTELVVPPLTHDDLMDLYTLMSALEGTAARRIEELSAPARKKLAHELERHEKEFQKAAQERKLDLDRVFDRHNAFHGALVDACARPRLRGMIEVVRPQVERYEWVYAPLVGPDYTPTFTEHSHIIDAVAEGHGKAAERAVSTNWLKGAERLAAVIGRVGARGDWQAAASCVA